MDEGTYVRELAAEAAAFRWALMTYTDLAADAIEAETVTRHAWRARDDPARALPLLEGAWTGAMRRAFGPNYWQSQPELIEPPPSYFEIWREAYLEAAPANES